MKLVLSVTVKNATKTDLDLLARVLHHLTGSARPMTDLAAKGHFKLDAVTPGLDPDKRETFTTGRAVTIYAAMEGK